MEPDRRATEVALLSDGHKVTQKTEVHYASTILARYQAAARSEREFFALLRSSGVLAVSGDRSLQPVLLVARLAVLAEAGDTPTT